MSDGERDRYVGVISKHEMVVDRDDYEDKTDLINRIHAKLKPYSESWGWRLLAKDICDMIEGRAE